VQTGSQSYAVYHLSQTDQSSPYPPLIPSPSITVHHSPHSLVLGLLIYTRRCMFIIQCVLLNRQISICLKSHVSAIHLASAASVSQILESGTLSLQLPECVLAPTLSAITSKPIISSRPSDPLSAFLLALQIQLTIVSVHVYK